MRLDLEERVARAQPESDIFVVKGTTGRNGGFRALLGLMGDKGLRFYGSETEGRTQSPGGLIPSDAVVIVKVNSQWDERGGTNTDLVKTMIRAILDHPDDFAGEVVVADNGQAQYGSTRRGGSLDYDRNNAEDAGQSAQDVADSFGDRKVSTYLWDGITTRSVGEYSDGDMRDGYVLEGAESPATGLRVSYPKFRTRHGTCVSFKHGVWDPEDGAHDGDRLKVINVPVLKAHFIYGVTACVKHYMGVVSDKLTGGGSHRSVGVGGMGTEMAGTRMPTLNVLDAIWVNANPSKGPRTRYDEATRLDTVMASADPIALDYWASKHVLMQTARLTGHRDLSKIDPDNRDTRSFGSWLRLSMEELTKAGHRVTVDEDRMNVYILDHQPHRT